MLKGENRMTNQQAKAMLCAIRIIIKQSPDKKTARKHIKRIDKQLDNKKRLTPNRDK